MHGEPTVCQPPEPGARGKKTSRLREPPSFASFPPSASTRHPAPNTPGSGDAGRTGGRSPCLPGTRDKSFCKKAVPTERTKNPSRGTHRKRTGTQEGRLPGGRDTSLSPEGRLGKGEEGEWKGRENRHIPPSPSAELKEQKGKRARPRRSGQGPRKDQQGPWTRRRISES